MKSRTYEIKILGGTQAPIYLSLNDARDGVHTGRFSPIDWCREQGQTEWRSVGEDPELCKYLPRKGSESGDVESSGILAGVFSLSDIAFLLLIYFLVDFCAVELSSIDVPNTDGAQEKTKQLQQVESFGGQPEPEPVRLILRVHADGRFSIDGVADQPQHYHGPLLEQLLRDAVETTDADELLVAHAPGTPYRHVVAGFNASLSVKNLKTTWQQAPTPNGRP